MQKIKDILTSSRVKSFVWRLGAVMAIAGFNYLQSQLTNYGFSPEVVVVAGLVLGEITKALNNYYQGL